MGHFVKIIGGASASLQALPNTKAAKEPAGRLEVRAENRSMVPVDLEVNFLTTSDPAVANVTPLNPPAKIHLPRRPNKRFGRTPSVKQQSVGSWQPVSSGIATLMAIVTATPPYVGSGGPTELVSVT
jgi:hypothetical protein